MSLQIAVLKFNPFVQWRVIKATCDFVYVKCTAIEFSKVTIILLLPDEDLWIITGAPYWTLLV